MICAIDLCDPIDQCIDPGMVVRDGISTLADLTTAVKRLGQARVEVKGLLFNGQMMRISSSYGYKYGNYKQGANQDKQS